MTGRARAVLVVLGLCAALGFGAFPLQENPAAAPLADASLTAAELSDIEQQRTARMDEDLAKGFPDAPADVLAVARTIIDGKVPSPEALAALGQEKLNHSWSQSSPKNFPTAGHSLLRQTVVSGNLEAAKVLITAGADLFYNGNEMPFQAIRMSTGQDRVWFPDYALGNAFLTVWLNNGGDANATCPLWSGGPILQSMQPDNLESTLTLIKAGADPWFNPSPPDDPTYFYDNFFELQANANAMSNEFAFRIAKEGLYRGADETKAAALVAQYEEVAEQYKDATGPENLRSVWAMQMALKEILPQLGVTPSGALAEMMKITVPSDIGGFFLAENELHSPGDPDQLVTTENQWGTERWGQ